MTCASWCQRSFHASQAQSSPCITKIGSWPRDCWKIGNVVLHLHTNKSVHCMVLCPWAHDLWDRFCASYIEGVTKLDGAMPGEYLHHLHWSLTNLNFGSDFNQSLEGVSLPSSLQSLRFGADVNQSLQQVTLPSSLQSLNFGIACNQSLQQVTLPSSLQSLNFGDKFNQSLEQVTLPSSLQSLSFGADFNQSLEQVTLPLSLQTSSFGGDFNQSLEQVTLPLSLQSFSACLASTRVAVSFIDV